MWAPEFFDPIRFDDALRASHRMTARVELWSNGTQVTAAAPITDGTVTDQLGTENLGIGVRRSLTLTVPPTPQWLNWLTLPGLQVRPFRGLVVGDTTVECPLGWFPIRVPEQARPVTAIDFKVDDYYSRVNDANLTWPVQAPGGALVRDNIAWIAWLNQDPHNVAPSILATSTAVTGDGLWFTKTRHDAVVQLAQSISAEVFFSRTGVPTIADARVLGAPTGSVVGLAEGFKRTPNWDALYNVVAASSTMSGVDFTPARAGITWEGHPAYPQNLGSPAFPLWRVYNFSSPLLADYGQALAAATTTLARVSALSETYTFTGVPDPRIDAGDSIIISTVDDWWKVAQVASVTHPLSVDGKQVITTIAANVYGSTDLNGPPKYASKHVRPGRPSGGGPITATFNGYGSLSAVVSGGGLTGVTLTEDLPNNPGTWFFTNLTEDPTYPGLYPLFVPLVEDSTYPGLYPISGGITAVTAPFTGSGVFTASIRGRADAPFTGSGVLSATFSTVVGGGGGDAYLDPFSDTYGGGGPQSTVNAAFTGVGALTASVSAVGGGSVTAAPFTGSGTLTATASVVASGGGGDPYLDPFSDTYGGGGSQGTVNAPFTGGGAFTAGVSVSGGGGSSAAPATYMFGTAATSGTNNGLGGALTLGTELSRHIDEYGQYYQWSFAGGFPATDMQAIVDAGAMPSITWEPWDPTAGVNQPTYSLANIANGNFDTYINQWAAAVATFNKPIKFRLMHEMNGNWYPWCPSVNGGSAANYIAAFRHVHDRFTAAGATKVIWVWSVNKVEGTPTNINTVYPGDTYVDSIGLDGYNGGSAGSNTPAQVFSGTIAAVTAVAPSKPVYISEVGCDPSGVDKPTWIRDIFNYLKTTVVTGVIWFGVSPNQLDTDAPSGPVTTAAKTAVTTVWIGSIKAWPTTTNTGPEAAGYSSLTNWTASYLISTDNAVITGQRFTDVGPQITGNNVTFRGCEFQATSPDMFAMRIDGTNTTFEDCRWRPTANTVPPITRAQSYQQGIKMFNGVGLTVKRCEFYGFGNAIEFEPGSSTQANPLVVQDSYFHDAADQAGSTYHHDGVLCSSASQYVTLNHNSIQSGGNTNAIAFQTPGGGASWHDLTITNNLVSGFGYTVNIGDDAPSANVTFTGNVFSTLIAPVWGPFKNNWAGFTGTNRWSGNRWSVPPGAAYGSAGWDGLYWWPTDGTNTGGHASDY